MSSQFRYISTFAGCGGSSLGYKWAGGRGLAAIEFDANAVATYRANFPDTPVIDRDIAKVTAEELMQVAKIGVGQLDILDGSPPCQGFSTAGKRVITDPRNSLFREYVRLIEGLQPRVFVMENVSGMVKGKMKLVFREVMLALKATGYDVRCKLLNAMYFNVPQSRERLIWIGVRPDVERPPTFPKAQGKPVTVREAIAETGLAKISPAPAWRAYNRQLWERMKPGQNGVDGSAFNHCRVHPDRPLPTVPKSCVFGGFSPLYHWSEARSLSIGELAQLTSFPSDFKWPAEYEDAHNRIGNCVPPRFAQAIAEHIRDEILEA